MGSILEDFRHSYSTRATSFVSQAKDFDTTGIPEPHLPHWGSLYENSPLKIGIIGRDTRSWGDMPDFIRAVGDNPCEAIIRGKGDFDSLDFTEWTNNFGKTFWDTSMKILAGLHGVSDWKRLKRREEEDILRSFMWANVNSVERYEVSPQGNDVSWDTWRSVKDASEKSLDSFKNILEIFTPNVVVLMNWDPGSHFIDFEICWDEFGNHQAYALYKPTMTLIFATAHPTWLNQNNLYDEAIDGIIKKANQSLTLLEPRPF